MYPGCNPMYPGCNPMYPGCSPVDTGCTPMCTQAFYRKRKIDHFEDLRESQKMRIQVRVDCPQMID